MLAAMVPTKPARTIKMSAAPARMVLTETALRSWRGMRKSAEMEASIESPVKPTATIKSAVKAIRTLLSVSIEL